MNDDCAAVETSRLSQTATPDDSRRWFSRSSRAMLGALGEELDMSPRLLDQLQRSLNPLSRFDFGRLSSLRHARQWQAK